MSEDQFNLSMRKFLKQVGVTSQQKIEEAVRAAEATGAPDRIRVTVTLTSDDIQLHHTVTGDIELS